jgi:hypothetical protein
MLKLVCKIIDLFFVALFRGLISQNKEWMTNTYDKTINLTW